MADKLVRYLTKYRIRYCCPCCGKWDVVSLPDSMYVARFEYWDAALDHVRQIQRTEMKVLVTEFVT